MNHNPAIAGHWSSCRRAKRTTSACDVCNDGEELLVLQRADIAVISTCVSCNLTPNWMKRAAQNDANAGRH